MEKGMRELPIVTIFNTTYLVDIEKDCLVEKGKEENSISFDLFTYTGTHYELYRWDSPAHVRWPFDYDWLRIPQKVALDPVGMALKYNLPLNKVVIKSDYDLIVDQQKYNDRVNKGMMPVIDIAGHKFFVDIPFEKLRSTTDPTTKIDLTKWLDGNDILQYKFFYNRETKQAVEIDYSITRLPAGVVWIEIPWDDKLDPVVVARRENLDIKNYLVTHPFEKELKAKVVPLSQTGLVEVVKRNKAALQKSNNDLLLMENRESKRKEKGKHQ